jgi:hypothetical protein
MTEHCCNNYEWAVRNEYVKYDEADNMPYVIVEGTYINVYFCPFCGADVRKEQQ